MGRFVVTVFFLVLFQSTYSSSDGTSPQFTAQPSDIIIASSSSTAINCRASGTPQPTIEWYKDNVRVILGGRRSVNNAGALLISMVVGTDTGSYHCVASNAVGSVRSFSASLQIASFTTFTPLPLQPSSILANDPYTLPCMLPPSSVPPATVSWEKNTQSITPSMLEGGRLGITLNGTFIFSSWSPAMDTGPFRCIVTNPLIGSPHQSSNYFLSLMQGSARNFVAMEFVALPPPSLTSIAGEKVQLECFTTGSPLANITWQKDGVELFPSQRVSLTQARRVLTLDPVMEGDGGSYTCVASQVTNSGLVTQRKSTQLSVIVPPTITQSFPETVVNASLPVSLTCRASGSLPLTWTWRRNGEELTSGRVGYGRSGTESTLTITGVEVGDGGVYQCLVQQTAHQTAAAANELLVVRTVVPFFTQGSALQDMLVFAGSTVLFPCMAVGFPPPQFTWVKAGTFQVDTEQERYHVPPFPSSNCSLTITSAMTQDTSVYQCNASNPFGYRITPAVQLHVISTPSILESPMSQTPSEGDTVTLRCRISTAQDQTAVYSWKRDGTPVPSPTTGEFTLANIQQSQNGVYECSASISVSGVNAPPLTMEVGRAVVTVGVPPTRPSAPLNPTFTAVSANSFLAHWDMPVSNGNLEIQNYTIEIQGLGNPLCPPVESEWNPAVTGVGPTSTSVTVGGLHPYTRYQFRVVAFNFLFSSSPSPVSAILWTEQAAPSAPPTGLVASPHGMGGELMVEWNPPTPCTTYGGPLTDYTVQFRVFGTIVYQDNLVGSNATSLLLSSLSPNTRYEIKVAAHTMAGRGSFTSAVTATTSGALCLGPPTNVAGQALNSTAVQLTWDAPANSGGMEVTAYVVSYQLVDDIFLRDQTFSFIVENLEPGIEYTFSVSAQSSQGRCTMANITITTTALTVAPDVPFYEMVWFYAVCGVGGLLLLCVVVVVCACLCCKICCKIGSENGKIYITTRRSGSSLSAASSGFSEYQQKHKVISRFVHVHDSPTPSRRSSDYADLEGVRQGHMPSMGAPSMSYSESSSAMMNGHLPPEYDPHGQIPYSIQDQYNPDVPMERLDRYDHMPMNPNFPDTSSTPGLPYIVEMPAPPPPNFPDFQPPTQTKNLSQDSEPSWNPADNLNYRGHMTNNPVSRSSSMRSTQSTVSADSSENDPFNMARSHYKEPRRTTVSSGGRSQLPPLQEHQVMEGEAHSSIHSMPMRRMREIHQMSSHSKSLEHMQNQGDGHSHHHHQHPVHSRSLNPRIGTEHGHPSGSLDHVSGHKPPLSQQPLPQQWLPQQRSYSQPAHMHQLSQRRAAYHHNPDAGGDFSSGQNFELRELQRREQFQFPEENSIPRTHISPPPEPKDRVSREQLSTRQKSLDHQSRTLPPPPVFQDAPDSSSRFIGERPVRGSAMELRHGSSQVHSNLRNPQSSKHSREEWQHNRRSPQSPEHSLSPKKEGQHNLRPREVVQQWVHDQTSKSAGVDSNPPQPPVLPQGSRWLDQRAESRPVQQPNQHNLWPRNAALHRSAGHILDSGLPPSHQEPIHSTRWEIQQQMNRLGHSLLQIDGKGQPPKKLLNGMQDMGHYPDVVQHSTNTAMSPLSSPEKSLPDLGRIDPRKPRLKKGKVPGAVWKPRPMNRAVESCSDDSGSETTMPDSGTEYDHGETTSLKSTHV